MTAGECKIGIMPGNIFTARQGRDRVALRHAHLRGGVPDVARGLGQTTAVGIGGDPVKGIDFIDVLEMFLADNATEAIVMIGEIGGASEEDAAQFLSDEAKRDRKKPMVGFIAGGRRRPAGAWAMPAPSSRAARATPAPRSPPWSRRYQGLAVAGPARQDARRAAGEMKLNIDPFLSFIGAQST